MALVVIIALLFWGGVFVVLFTEQGITLVEFFLGRYEPPPSDLGIWKELGSDEQSGLLREERFLLPRGNPSAGQMLHQIRYRDPVMGVIVRVEPERRVRRRRVSARGSP